METAKLNKKYDGSYVITWDIPQTPPNPFKCSNYKDLSWTEEWINFNLDTILNCPIGGFTGWIEP